MNELYEDRDVLGIGDVLNSATNNPPSICRHTGWGHVGSDADGRKRRE